MDPRPVIIQSALTTVILISLAASANAAINDCRRLLMTGEYDECVTMAREAIENRKYGEDWPVLKLRAERELGRYEEAVSTAAAGIERYPWSIRLHYESFLGRNE